jgi:outer membrane protein
VEKCCESIIYSELKINVLIGGTVMISNFIKYALIGSLVCAQSVFAVEGLVGTVALQKVLQETKEGQQIRGKLKDFVDSKTAEIKKEQERIEKMRKDYEKQAAVLNDKARIEKETKIQEEMIAFDEKRGKYQKEFEEMEKKMRDPMLEKLYKIVEEISKKNEVTITFEKGTAPVLYYAKEKDLTDEVTKAYDAKYPVKK